MHPKDCASPSPTGRRWPEGPDEGVSFALTRRFAAPSPRGRGWVYDAPYNFAITACFNSSRPSPVTEEILISSNLLFLHQRSSFRTFLGSAASIFAATTILSFF